MRTSPTYNLVLIAVQGFCAAIFISDAISDIFYRSERDWHIVIEVTASIALMLAIALETRNLLELLQRKANLERTLKNASLAVHSVVRREQSAFMWFEVSRRLVTLAGSR